MQFSTFFFFCSFCGFKHDDDDDDKLLLIRKEVDSAKNCDRVELTEDVLVLWNWIHFILFLKVALLLFLFTFCFFCARENLILLYPWWIMQVSFLIIYV